MSRYLEQQEHVNFTRNTIRRRWNDQGEVEHVNSGSNFVSYNPATGESDGWVIMETHQQRFQRPRQLDQWSGVTSLLEVTQNQIGIDGETNTGFLVDDLDPDGQRDINLSMGSFPTDSENVRFQCFVKKDTNKSFYSAFEYRLFQGSEDIEDIIWLRVSDGDYTHNNPSGSLSVTDVGDWWRMDYVVDNYSNCGAGSLQFYPAFSDFSEEFDNLTGSVVADCFQAFADKPEPPVTPVYDGPNSPFTQSADDVIVTDMNAIEYNQDEGTFVMEYKSPKNPSDNGVFELYGDDQNRLGLRHKSDGTDEVLLLIGGTTYNINPSSSAVGNDVSVEVRIAYTSNSLKFKVNGSLIEEIAIPSFISANEIRVGQFMGEYLNSTIKKFKYYPADIT